MASAVRKFFTIPNMISIARIIMIPFFAWAFLTPGYEIAALIIVVISGISDKLDGTIARKFNQVSEMGKMLDPLADKLTQVTLAFLMFWRFVHSADALMRFTGWVFLGFIGKEVLMLLFALFMLIIGKRPAAAEIWGKVATVVFYVVMGVLLLVGPDVGIFAAHWTLWPVAVMILVVLNLVLMVIAFLSYIPDTYRKVIKERKSEK